MRLGIITLKLDYSKILKTYSKLIIPCLIKNQVAILKSNPNTKNTLNTMFIPGLSNQLLRLANKVL